MLFREFLEFMFMELNENLSVPFHCFYTWLPLDVGVGGEDGGGIIQNSQTVPDPHYFT